MQINSNQQTPPNENLVPETQTITDVESPSAVPSRRPSSSQGFSPEFMNMYADSPATQGVDPQTKQKEEIKVKAQEWLRASEINPGMSKVGPAVATAPIALVEDIYNTGIDFTNFVSKAFGGDKVLENSNALTDWMPQDNVSVVSREITKFLIGYGAIAKTASAAYKATTTLGKMSQSFAAGAVADLVTAQPQADSLFEDMVQRLPMGPELLDLVIDEDDTNFEKRLREVVYGGVTGVLAESLIRGVRYFRKNKQIVESLSTVPEAPKAAASEAGEKAPKEAAKVESIPSITRDELPPIPETDYLDASLKPVEPEKVRAIRMKQVTGQGAVNEITGSVGDDKVFINLAKMDTPDDIRRLVSNVVSESPEKYAKKTYTEEEIARLAAEWQKNPEELAAWEQATGIQRGQLLAVADMKDQAAESMHNAYLRFNEGIIGEQELGLYTANFEKWQAVTRDMENLAGGVLQESSIATKKVGKANRAKQLAEYKKVFGEDNARIAKQVALGATPGMMKRAYQKSMKVIGPVSNALAQMRYAGMLSNPATHMRNLFGGAMNIGVRSGESLLASSFNLIKRDPYGVTFGETYHESLGAFQGMLEGFQITAAKMKGQEAKFLGVNPKKAKIPDQILEQINQQVQTGNPLLRGLGHAFNGKFVSDALRLEDDFMKHINARMTLNREAYKKGYLEGTRKGLPAAEVEAIVAKELNDPSVDTLQKMYRDAEYNTFTNDVQGSFLSSLDTFSRDNPVMRLVAPFARTNLNAMSYKLERVPGINFLLDVSRKEFNSIDPAVRQRMGAKMAFSTMTMAGLAGYFHSRDAIIGSGPSQSERWKFFDQAGYQRNSIKVGDKWVEFRQETPLGGILSLISDIAELRDITDDEQMVQDYGMVATTLVAQLFNPDYLTNSVGELMAALASEDADKARAIINTGTGIAGQFLPYSGLIRGVQRELIDSGAMKRETIDSSGALSGLLDTFRNQVLGIYYPQALSISRNILGQPMYHKQGFGMDLISPFGAVEESKNPVIKELARLTGKSMLTTTAPKFAGQEGFDSDYITIQMPSRVIELGIGDRAQRRKLSPDQYTTLVQYSAGIHPSIPEDQSLENVLKRTFESDSYKNSSFRAQGVIAKRIVSKYRELGKKLFLSAAVDKKEIRDIGNSILNEYRDDDRIE